MKKISDGNEYVWNVKPQNLLINWKEDNTYGINIYKGCTEY